MYRKQLFETATLAYLHRFQPCGTLELCDLLNKYGTLNRVLITFTRIYVFIRALLRLVWPSIQLQSSRDLVAIAAENVPASRLLWIVHCVSPSGDATFRTLTVLLLCALWWIERVNDGRTN